MKTMKSYAFMLFACTVFLTVSCVKDVDFNQLDDAVLTPVFEADFIYSQFDIEEFIPDGLPPDTEFTIPVERLRDTINYDLTSTDFAIENLDRVELTIEVRNTIERDFSIVFQFLTADGTAIGELYNVPVAAGMGAGTAPVVSFSNPNPIVLDNPTLVELANARRVYTEILIPAPPLNTNLRGVIDLRSKATYYINYEL
ncbi:hypothetical protein [Aquimarina sp. MMG016]|uniref:hypothetical protein n=1 Tax=Aquimarina sp. MMG016 TaxID=2822690 RepID=UPI001B3A7AFA|nr:hypothetical protein [Aquimarina sp. MMG016]MBQ4821472.1 hypothetical protein [Aquimarina sp. MMG016]